MNRQILIYYHFFCKKILKLKTHYNLISNQFFTMPPKNCKSMPSLYFTAHPFAEPSGAILMPNYCCCNRQAPHLRKLLHATNAEVVDGNNELLKNQDIYFLGEFEGCSNYTPNSNYPTTSSYRNIHTPLFLQPRCNGLILNTDPFVFGNTFYYSCCKIRPSMATGDLVLFGHRRKSDFYIDTVLVLDKLISRETYTQYNLPTLFVDYNLSLTSGGHFWLCRMYAQDQQLFSFIPCKIGNSAIKYPKVSIPGLSTQANGGSMHGVNVQSIFNSIVQQIRAQGFDLAVKLDTPPTSYNPPCYSPFIPGQLQPTNICGGGKKSCQKENSKI